MFGCIFTSALVLGLWSVRSNPVVQVVWSDRVKPSVFLVIAAVLICRAETTSDKHYILVASGGQYFVAAAAVIAAAITGSKKPQDSSISSGTLSVNEELAE